jgi:N-acetylglucosamine transport system substrate-binding protein
MPFAQTQVGIFYNADLFEKNKWPQPDSLNWDEFMDLNKEIAKTGLAPWTFQGKVAGYLGCLVDPLIYKKAGPQAYCDIDNLTEGAWKNPDVMWVFDQAQRIFKEGWVFKGSEAMMHTEAQQVFMDGKAAMVLCGTWLKREMEATTPPGFRMKLSGIPAPKDAKGFAKALVNSPGGSDIVVGNGKHPLWAIEFLRLMYSPQIAKYVAEQIGGMLAVNDPLAGAKADESLQSAVAAVNAADGHYVRYFYRTWYGTLTKVLDDSWGDLAYSKISVEQLTDNLERAAKEIREDPKAEKHTSPDCPKP